MPSPLSAITAEILAAASRHLEMLQATENDHDLASALDEIARDQIAIVERIVAAKKVRERRASSSAPAEHDDFDSLMVAAEMSKPSAAEKSFLLSLEDIYRRCATGLPDVMNGTWNPIADIYVALLRLGSCGRHTAVGAVYEHVLGSAHALIIEAKASTDMRVAA